MKPCSNNRKLIAWLALDALDAREERTLRSHLGTCEGCRHYLEELSNVTEKLAAADTRTGIQTSEAFHQKLVGRLRKEEADAMKETFAAHLQAAFGRWQVVVPALAAAAVLVFGLFLAMRRPELPSPAQSGPETVAKSSTGSDLDPSLSNYRLVAKGSLEKLDELLARQGQRNPSPTPVYTASSLARAMTFD